MFKLVNFKSGRRPLKTHKGPRHEVPLKATKWPINKQKILLNIINYLIINIYLIIIKIKIIKLKKMKI